MARTIIWLKFSDFCVASEGVSVESKTMEQQRVNENPVQRPGFWILSIFSKLLFHRKVKLQLNCGLHSGEGFYLSHIGAIAEGALLILRLEIICSTSE